MVTRELCVCMFVRVCVCVCVCVCMPGVWQAAVDQPSVLWWPDPADPQHGDHHQDQQVSGWFPDLVSQVLSVADVCCWFCSVPRSLSHCSVATTSSSFLKCSLVEAWVDAICAFWGEFYSQFIDCLGCTWFVGLFCWFIDESLPYWFCLLVCALQRCCCLHELLSGEWERRCPRGEREQERSAGVWTHTWQRCRPRHCSGRVWDQPDACLSCQGQCGLELCRDEAVWLSDGICLRSVYTYRCFLHCFRLWALHVEWTLWTPSDLTLRHSFFVCKLDPPCFLLCAAIFLCCKFPFRICCCNTHRCLCVYLAALSGQDFAPHTYHHFYYYYYY